MTRAPARSNAGPARRRGRRRLRGLRCSFAHHVLLELERVADVGERVHAVALDFEVLVQTAPENLLQCSLLDDLLLDVDVGHEVAQGHHCVPAAERQRRARRR
jgi:hypothetical protein